MRSTGVRILRIGCCLLLASMFLLRCGFTKQLMKAGDQTFRVLQKDDWKGFQKLATPKLLNEFKENDFRRLTAAIRKLGELKRLKQSGSRQDCGDGRMFGEFTLKFDKAKVVMNIAITKAGKLDTFKFRGGGLEKI